MPGCPRGPTQTIPAVKMVSVQQQANLELEDSSRLAHDCQLEPLHQTRRPQAAIEANPKFAQHDTAHTARRAWTRNESI